MHVHALYPHILIPTLIFHAIAFALSFPFAELLNWWMKILLFYVLLWTFIIYVIINHSLFTTSYFTHMLRSSSMNIEQRTCHLCNRILGKEKLNDALIYNAYYMNSFISARYTTGSVIWENWKMLFSLGTFRKCSGDGLHYSLCSMETR